MRLSKKFINIISSVAVFSMVIAPFSVIAADFNPSNLIEDRVFSDIQTFGSAAGIQQFLQSKNSVLANTDTSFLLQLKEPQDVNIKIGLEDPGANTGRLRTAAELIWDASKKTGLNPQVILVTLQKEQSLITGTFDPTRLQRALDVALGFGCPDGGGCESILRGFYFQLFGNFDSQGNRYLGAAASLMRSFNTSGGRGPAVNANNEAFGGGATRTSKVNDTIILGNTQGPPNNAPATQAVTLSNSATAALYRYTPHVYNGNFNFWKFFQSWFKYPNGTLIKLASDSQTYIINNGLKSLIPNFVMVSRNLNAGSTIIVSPTEFADLQTGPLYGPADNVMVKVQGDASNRIYVFKDNVRHPASEFVTRQRGLNPANAIIISQQDADLFAPGSLLVPSEGTLIKGDQSATVYVISQGKKMALSGFTFSQYGYSFRNVNTVPQFEVEQYEGSGFMLPKEGTLVTVKGIPGTYIIQSSLIKPVSDNVFALHKFNRRNVVALTPDEVGNAGLGSFLAPPDGTYFRTPAGHYYYYKNGSKHHVSPFVFRQRSIASVAVGLAEEEALLLPDGSPLTPRDNTLVKGDQSQAIFVIKNGQKQVLDFNTWVGTYRRQAPNVVPQAEVDGYPIQGDECDCSS